MVVRSSELAIPIKLSEGDNSAAREKRELSRSREEEVEAPFDEEEEET